MSEIRWNSAQDLLNTQPNASDSHFISTDPRTSQLGWSTDTQSKESELRAMRGPDHRHSHIGTKSLTFSYPPISVNAKSMVTMVGPKANPAAYEL